MQDRQEAVRQMGLSMARSAVVLLIFTIISFYLIKAGNLDLGFFWGLIGLVYGLARLFLLAFFIRNNL